MWQEMNILLTVLIILFINLSYITATPVKVNCNHSLSVYDEILLQYPHAAKYNISELAFLKTCPKWCEVIATKTLEKGTEDKFRCLLYYDSFKSFCSEIDSKYIPLNLTTNLKDLKFDCEKFLPTNKNFHYDVLKKIEDSKICNKICINYDETIEPSCSLAYYFLHFDIKVTPNLIIASNLKTEESLDKESSENLAQHDETSINLPVAHKNVKGTNNVVSRLVIESINQNAQLDRNSPNHNIITADIANAKDDLKSGQDIINPNTNENPRDDIKSKKASVEANKEYKDLSQDKVNLTNTNIPPESGSTKIGTSASEPGISSTVLETNNRELKEHNMGSSKNIIYPNRVSAQLNTNNIIAADNDKPDAKNREQNEEAKNVAGDSSKQDPPEEKVAVDDGELKAIPPEEQENEENTKNINIDDDEGETYEELERPAAKKKEKPTTLNDEPANYNNAEELDGESYFFSYFMVVCVLFVLGYVAYHNRQKVLALVLEGKRGKKQYRGRRPNSANYHKLDSNLEEAISSSCTKNSSHVIY